MADGDKKFPENTQGFLYYHRDPRLPSITGEIRFRVTNNPNPASFKDGFDLLSPDGELPWSILLLQSPSPLRELAIQDRLIEPKTIVSRRQNFGRLICLTFLEQPFVLDLQRRKRMAIVTPQEVVEKSSLRLLFPDPSCPQSSCLTGKLLVSFEQASLVEGVRGDGTSIVMRCLKVLEPIKPIKGFHPIPRPGDLLKYASRGQILIREFESPYLKLLPSVKSSTPSPSDGPACIIPKIRRNLFAARYKTISTLDPCRLQSSDFCVLSGRQGIYMTGQHVQSQRRIRVRYSCDRTPFPDNTYGFFYMHIDPRLPLVSGQIRFRITTSNDPAQFENGTDLFIQGEPWKIHAVRIAHFAPLIEQLRGDGYAEYAQTLSSLPLSKEKPARVQCYLEQPFVMDMSFRRHSLFAIVSDKILSSFLVNTFFDSRRSKLATPYTGRIVVCFERSTLPEHARGNFVVLRVLKILDPIALVDPDYDMHVPMPRVGSLLFTTRNRVCSYNLDESRKLSVVLKRLPSIPDIEPDL
ncbi:hypothetical protein H2248_007082 [Termitomyces sp. 'cryptogamus']|nr:hypothetical protein H2248_007082 [Termitomyces sp. 'cryptogamus']